MMGIKTHKILVIALAMFIICNLNTTVGQDEENEISFSEPKELMGGLYLSGEGDDDGIYLFGQYILAHSVDKGHNWSYNGLEGYYGSYETYSRFDIANGIIYRMMYCRDLDVNREEKILFLKSEDGGDSWSDPIEISTLKGSSEGFFGINVIQDNIFVYFYDRDAHTHTADIMVARSTDDGETWNSAKVSSYIAMTDSFLNDIVYKDGKLYLAFYTYTSPGNIEDIKTIIAVSDDMGKTWDKNEIDKGGWNPVIRVGGNNLYITFLKMDGIYFTKSENGKDWSQPVKIGEFIDHDDATMHYSITVKSNLIFVSYLQCEIVGDTDIYDLQIIYSKDHGETWLSIDSPTGLQGNSMAPHLFIHNNTLYFCWTFTGEEDWTTNHSTSYIRSASLDKFPIIEEDADEPQDSPGYPIMVVLTSIVFTSMFIEWRRHSKKKKSR